MINITNLSSLVENSQGSELLVPSYAEMELVAMNEATYYGKNKDLLAVEKILDEMCVIARTKGTGAKEFSLKMTEVGERLAALFGFKSLLINSSILDLLFYSNLNDPGYTYCHSNIYKYTLVAIDNGKTANVVTADDSHSSVKFDPKFNYVMRMGIGPGLFLDRGSNALTGAEILAIILHEIGHNFYIGPVKELLADALSLLTIRDLVQLLLTPIVSVTLTEGLSILEDNMPECILSTIRQLKNFLGPIYGVYTAIEDILLYPKVLLQLPLIITRYIVSIPFEFPNTFLKYDSEKYSDAFAASYGYGVELTTALNKISERGIPKAPPLVNDLASLPYGILNVALSGLTQFLDPHPNNMGRLNNNIKYMEEAGKRKMSPALKTEYDAALKEMYEYRDAARSYKGININKLDNRYHLWLQSLTHVTDIKDIGSTFNIFKKYKNLDFD